MIEHEVKNNDDLLSFFVAEAEKDNKQWYGRLQQKIAGISLAHQIAARHADKMTPDEVVDYVNKLNNSIFNRIINTRNIV